MAWGEVEGEEEEEGGYFDEAKARDRLLKTVLKELRKPVDLSDIESFVQVDGLGKVLAKVRAEVDVSDLMDHEYVIGEVIKALADRADFVLTCEDGDYLFFFRQVGGRVITGKYVYYPNNPDDYTIYVGDFTTRR